MESLIYAGAFDCFGKNRAQVAAVYESVLARVNAMDKQKAGAQISLFGEILEEQEIEVNFPEIAEFETMEKLSKEKEVLGVYVSGHPFEKFLPYFKDESFNCAKLNEFTEDEETGEKTYTEIEDGQPVSMGGMVAAFKKLQTKSGQFMAFVTVEDLYGSVECVCFPKVYDKIKSFLKTDAVVALSGKMSVSADKAPAIIVERMTEFNEDEHSAPKTAQAMSSGTQPAKAAESDKPKRLWLNITGMEEADVDELMETLTFYEGETEVVCVQGREKFRCTQKVCVNRALMAELSTFLSENCIKLA